MMSSFAGPAPRTIHHVDLADVIPALDHGAGRGAFVVACSQGVPLGTLDLAPERLPLSSTQLADLVADAVLPAIWGHLIAPHAEVDGPTPTPALETLARLTSPLASLATALRLPSGSADRVSVIVCTRSRAAQLAECLRGLEKLDPPPTEIIVVDNAPDEGTAERVVAEHAEITYVPEPRPGLDIARNTGVRHSTGDIIAFTDDDAVVEPDWAGRIGHAFAHDIDALVGLVLPTHLETSAQVIFEEHWSLGRGCTPRVYGPAYVARRSGRGIPVWEIGAGVNMAFRRAALERVGDFDERLDAGASGCSGDSEMWYRILRAGGRIRYEPTAVVHHRHRSDDAALREQIFNYLRGLATSLLVQFEHDHDLGNLRHLLVTLPFYYARLAHRRRRLGPDARTVVLGEEVRGMLAGCRYYMRCRLEGTA